MPSRLDYASRETRPAGPPMALFRVALACWAAPLMSGIALLLVEAVTQPHWPLRVGLAVKAAALIMLLVGTSCLAGFRTTLKTLDPFTDVHWRQRCAVVHLLLLSNLPAALLCAAMIE